MAALPYMMMYWADYFADTPHLNTEEHGAYMLIIGAYWNRGKSIPVHHLPSISKLNERWTQVEPTLNEFFTRDEQGNWYHARIEAELAKVHAKSVKASAAGKASAAKRLKLQQQTNECSTDVECKLQLKSNHTDTDTDTDTDNKKICDSSEKKSRTDHNLVLSLYEEILVSKGRPKVLKSMWEKSQSATNLRNCWNRKPEFQTEAFWRAFFETVSGSDWWMGKSDRWPKGVDLHWLVKKSNFEKVVQEGINA